MAQQMEGLARIAATFEMVARKWFDRVKCQRARVDASNVIRREVGHQALPPAEDHSLEARPCCIYVPVATPSLMLPYGMIYVI
jgi:hypothetical protein